MFNSATKILKKSAFSLGSRCRARLEPSERVSAVPRFVGCPSAESHTGGEEAVGVRIPEGMHVCSGIVIAPDFEYGPPVPVAGLIDTGMWSLDQCSCQACSSEGDPGSECGGLRYRRNAGEGWPSDGGGRLSSVSSGLKENTELVRKSSGGRTGFAAIEVILCAADFNARNDAVRFERNVELLTLGTVGRDGSFTGVTERETSNSGPSGISSSECIKG